MAKSCCAVDCHSAFKKGNGIHFYKFPENPELRAKWISAVRREGWQPSQYTLICSKHFISGEKSTDPLSPDYIPSVFKSVSSAQKRKLEEGFSRYERRKATKRKRNENMVKLSGHSARTALRTSSVPLSSSRVNANSNGVLETLQNHIEQATKAKECWELKEPVRELEKQVNDLTNQNRILQTVIDDYKSRTDVTETVLKDDDKKVKYYTGLPSYELLKIVFDFVAKGLPDCL